MKEMCLRFIRDTEGQDLIEYALLAATIALGALTAMRSVSTAINTEFNSIASNMTAGS